VLLGGASHTMLFYSMGKNFQKALQGCEPENGGRLSSFSSI